MESKSVNNKRIAENTLLLYVRMLFSMIVSLYTSRVVLNALGVEDFGIYNVVGGIVSMLSLLSNMMATATQRFLTYSIGKENDIELKNLFSVCLFLHIVFAVLIVVLGETIGLWFLNTHLVIPDKTIVAANWVFQFSLVSAVFTIISVPFNACIISHEKMGAFAYISILEVLLKLIIAIVINHVHADRLILYGLLLALSSVFMRFVYGVYCNHNFVEARFKPKYDKYIVKKIGTFLGWSSYAHLSGLATGQGLNILLNLFFGPSVNAARAIAYQVENAALAFTTNFQMAINPQIVKLYARTDLPEMHKLMIRSSRFSFYLMQIVTIPLLIYTDEILRLWLGSVPNHTVVFCRLALTNSLLNTLSNSLTTSTQATGKLRLNSILGGTNFLLILPVSYILLRLGQEPETVFYVTLFFSLIALGIRLFINKQQIDFPVKYFVKNVFLRCWGVTILSIVISILLAYKFDDSLITMILIMTLSVAISITAIFYMGLTKGEMNYIIKKMKQITNSKIK